MAKRIIAYLIKQAGIFLSFCGVTGLCILILFGVIIQKILSHKTNELEFTIEWMKRENHPYFVSLYLIVCIAAIVALRRNFKKENAKLLSSKNSEPADRTLKNA